MRPGERIWDRVWPENWPQQIEYGRESMVWHLYHNAVRHPDKTAIVYYGTEISYRQLNGLIWQAAGGLQRLGVRKGDRVYLALENCPQFVIAYYGVLALGAVVIAGSPMYKGGEMQYVLNDSGASVLIIEDVLYPIYEGIQESVPAVEQVVLTSLGHYLPADPTLPVPPGIQAAKPHASGTISWEQLLEGEPIRQLTELDIRKDIALLQYTSGTTGNPKGAMITHFNLLANAMSSPIMLETTEQDVHLTVLPLFHVTGMTNSMNGPLYIGCTMVLIARFDTETLLMAIDRYRCSVWIAITTMNIAIINHPRLQDYDITSLRAMISGGAPLPPAVVKMYQELAGANLIEGYGMSETISCTIFNPLHRNKLGSVGIPVIGVDIRVVDLTDDTRAVGLGEEGELWLRGPSVGVGYWNNPAATRETFLDGGWMRTGDIVKLDEEGYVYICGRTKELIKSSGYSVYPAEVEEYLYHHPAIAECCVIGVPHAYRGEEVKAFIVLRSDWQGRISASELIDWARNEMSAYKYPRQVEFREALPKSGTGKIMRKILKAEAEASATISP